MLATLVPSLSTGILISGAVAAVLTAWYVSLIGIPIADQKDDLVVTTRCGPIQGVEERSTKGEVAHVFKGIPYASPPTGRRRWKPPTAPEVNEDGTCWEGTLNASEFGSACPQVIPWLDQPFRGNENCLYLDVYVPKTNKTKLLPVVAWIHGGGFFFGSGHEEGYGPDADFVHSMGAIAVGISYRLLGFGFLALDVLSKQSATNSSGNYGLMDQIFALRWIQENIKAFGGDPNRVTVLGHSAGGKSLLAILHSPLAHGLFHGAIVASPCPVFKDTYQEASKFNQPFLTKTNCLKETDEETLECLYNLTSAEVSMTAFSIWMVGNYMQLPTKGVFSHPIATIEPVVLPVSPTEVEDDPHFKGEAVPIMVTTVAQETDFFDVSASELTEQPFDVLKAKIRESLDSFSPNLTEQALVEYSDVLKLGDNGLTYITMTSDARVNCPTNVIARKMAASNNKHVYRLVTTNRPKEKVTYVGRLSTYAFHGWDLLALFNFQEPGAGNDGPLNLYKPSKDELKLRDFLLSEYSHFVNFGRPRNKAWTLYPKVSAVYDQRELKVQEKDYHWKQCQLWDDNNFFEYGWKL